MNETPLHIPALLGCVDFIRALLLFFWGIRALLVKRKIIIITYGNVTKNMLKILQNLLYNFYKLAWHYKLMWQKINLK